MWMKALFFMMTIDGRIIDTLFQPIVNRLGRHPADMAMAMATAAAVTAITAVAIVLLTSRANATLDLLVVLTASSAIFALLMTMVMIRHLRHLIQPGVPNLLRYFSLPARLAMTFALAALTTGMLLTLTLWSLAGLLALSHLLWITSSYFLSCGSPPVRPARRARRHLIPSWV